MRRIGPASKGYVDMIFPRWVPACVAAGALVASILVAVSSPATATATAAARTGAAPGAPGKRVAFIGANKAGFGTAAGRRHSPVWFTLRPGGGTSEIYYPRLDMPAARALGFVVAGPGNSAVRVANAATHSTTQIDPRSLTYREVDTGPGARWRLVTTYVTDPARSALRIRVGFTSLDGRAYRLYTTFEPTLTNTPTNDSGFSRAHSLVAFDGSSASALRARPAFTATSTGFRGTSDGWTDLSRDGRMNWHFSSARAGNLVQTGRTTLTGRPGHRALTLTLGFGARPATALSTTGHAARAGFARTARAYRSGWHHYLHGLRAMPASLRTAQQRREYLASEMVLAASEDKHHPGAFVASPTMPWAWAAQHPSAPYHLVWSRDQYEIATALIADGDRAAANRALNFLFDRQQKADGSFPQNSDVTGKPVWTGLQLDEVADPILLAYQLHRFGAVAYRHVKAAADFIVNFRQDTNVAPWSPQERWENQSGYSPATIASEISGLVCAAAIARANSDTTSARRYLATADSWRRHLKEWTVTRTGPYSSKPYFLRLTKDGRPNRGTTYAIGDSGPGAADQRTVVDPSFLELVRLGVLAPNDATVRNSVRVVDRKLSFRTARGRFWHRASFDGYGETAQGKPWTLGNPDNSFLTHGRGWPILNGERGEYALSRGRLAMARAELATIARTANSAGLFPEQVWDTAAPGGRPGFTPGTPTLSATPLAWTHAQFIRLARDLSARRLLEQPRAVAKRYGT
jgi:glucoamylase